MYLSMQLGHKSRYNIQNSNRKRKTAKYHSSKRQTGRRAGTPSDNKQHEQHTIKASSKTEINTM